MQENEIQSLKKELEETKQKLREKELLFDNILESTLAGFWDWHIPEDYEYLSPTFKSMFGYTDEELANHPSSWQKIIYQDDLKDMFGIFEAHVQSHGKVPFQKEVRYHHKDGSTVWVYCNGRVTEWDDEGNPLRAVGCHIDITPLKVAMQKLSKQKQNLELRNKEVEQFAYVASHDLQEPLRTILSFVELLKDQYTGKLDEQANIYLKFIYDASKRMCNLVRGLLEYSLIGKDRVLKQVDTKNLIKNILQDLSTHIKETEANFEISNLPTISGYETELRLLFQNLISNAIKFRKKGVAPVVKIDAELKGNKWEFTIADNGIGIPKDYSKKIFAIFQRLHSREEYKGTGIGLAHCQKIVELHGGKIWVESEPEKGSTFHISLPQKPLPVELGI